MKSSVFSLAFVAGLVAAQSGKLPSCATSCVTKYTTGDGIADCGQVDVKCICSNESFLEGIACCLDEACDVAGKAEAVKYAQQICSSAGVSVPDEVVCKNPAGSSTGTASGSESAASETASESGSEESSAAETGTEAATGTGSGAATTAATTGAATGTQSVAPASTSNAAVGVNGAGGLMGALMALVVAL